ncbi:MAG: hypothetical protein KDA84_05290, partial [Planctomycetaceae bacterium]|nr:hypothetical protein [Planctomycetaceae bacterium]
MRDRTLCLVMLLFGLAICSIAFIPGLGDGPGVIVVKVSCFVLGLCIFTAAIRAIKTEWNTSVLWLVLGERMRVRWLKANAEYDYHQIKGVRIHNLSWPRNP